MMNGEHEVEQWLRSNSRTLYQAAVTGFHNQGRGAILVDLSNPNEHRPMSYYVSPEQLRAVGFEDEALYHTLSRYDPVREFIVAAVSTDGISHFKFQAYPLAR